MGERLGLFWYRFKYAVLAVGLLLPAMGGIVLNRLTESSTDATGKTVSIDGSITVLASGPGLLTECFTKNPQYNEDRRNCLDRLPEAWPIVASGAGVLLPESAGTTSEDAAGGVISKLTNVRAVAEGDLDNDGHPEQIVALDTTGSVPFKILSTDTKGVQVDTTALRFDDLKVTKAPAEILLADINRDGWLDLVTRTDKVGMKDSVDIYTNRGWAAPGRLSNTDDNWSKTLGKALEAIPAGATGQGVTAVRVVDLDRDGFQDFLTVSYNGVLNVLWGAADGFEAEYLSLPVPVGVVDMELSDINRDDRTDILLGVDIKGSGGLVDGVCPFNRPCDRGRGLRTGGVVTLLGQGRRDLASEPSLFVDGITYVTSMELADLDNDGWEELVIGRETREGSGETLDSNGALLYAPQLSGANDNNTLAGYVPATKDPLGELPAVRFIGSGDFDRDGDIDLVFSGRSAKSLISWENTGKPGNWIRVDVAGAAGLDRIGSNPDGLGALVEVVYGGKMLRREIGASGGRGEIQATELLIGLGRGAERVDRVTVYFPISSKKLEKAGVAVGTELLFTEPSP